jgi:hypothetical protein
MLVDRDKAIEACAKEADAEAEWSSRHYNDYIDRSCMAAQRYYDMYKSALRVAAAIRQLTLEDCRVEVDIEQLQRIEQVCYDLHEALGVKWGDDPYASIRSLSAQVAELQRKNAKLEMDWMIEQPYRTYHYWKYRTEAAEAQVAELRKALAELIACKDLKDAFEPHFFQTGQHTAEHARMKLDYERRKPLAWKAARAIVDAAKESGNE